MLIGVWRGFIREVLSLVSWVLAFWVAFTFAQTASIWFENLVDKPSLRVVAAFAALFIATLLVAGLIGFLIYRLLAATGVTGTDRGLGALFGMARGVAVIAVIVLVADMTGFSQEPWWRQSVLAGYFQPATALLKDLLPAEAAAQIS